VTAYEAETLINFNEGNDFAEVYTSSARVRKILTGQGFEPYQVDRFKGRPCGWHFQISKTAILLKPEKKSIKIGGSRKKPSIASSAKITPAAESKPVRARPKGRVTPKPFFETQLFVDKE